MRRYHPGFAPLGGRICLRAGTTPPDPLRSPVVGYRQSRSSGVRFAPVGSLAGTPVCAAAPPDQYPESALSTTATRPDRAMPRAAWTWADRRGFDDRGRRLPVHTHLLDAR